jgi:hypothetical protein
MHVKINIDTQPYFDDNLILHMFPSQKSSNK